MRLRGAARALAGAGILLLAGCREPVGNGARPDDAEEALLAELAGALDPTVPGLAGFFDAWEDGRVGAAREELLGYFRGKPVPQAALPERLPVVQALMVSALDAWRGVFSFQGVRGRAAEPDGPIDWSSRGPKDDAEWAWFLHRHFFLREMLVLYEVQGHEEFAQRMRDYVLDWFWRFPPPDRRSFSPAWRALEAARRIVEAWLPVYDRLRDDPAFGDEAVLAILAGAARHADYLREHHHYGGNHLVTEMMALATVAAVWPEFRRSGEWMDYAVARALVEMERQVYPDGAHKELANHYQWIAGRSFQRLYEVVEIADREEARASLRPRMERMWDYYAGVVRPDGTGPLNNDSDLEPNAAQLLPLASYFDRPDWVWIATGGAAGEAPEGPPSRWFPWAGHAVLRSGWQEDADWVFFDQGAFGTDHFQEDRLHVSAALKGKNLLVDSGRYVYRDDEWSRFFRGPLAHNVPTFERLRRVVPDREATRPAEGGLRFDGPLVWTAGWIPLADGVAWTGRHGRAVLLGPGFVWIVDRVEAPRSDRATFRWRFAPELRLVADENAANPSWEVIGGDAVLARWSLSAQESVAVARAEGRGPPAIQGWFSPEFNERLPNEVLEVGLPVEGGTTLSWLLATESVAAGLSHAAAGNGASLRWEQAGRLSAWNLEWSGGEARLSRVGHPAMAMESSLVR